MNIVYPGFGTIVVEGTRFDHDVVVDAGLVRPRNKKASRSHRAAYGHTPLSVDEDIPWSTTRLIIGTGFSGRLPVMPEVLEHAAQLGVEIVAVPTAEAAELLAALPSGEVHAVLHVTC